MKKLVLLLGLLILSTQAFTYTPMRLGDWAEVRNTYHYDYRYEKVGDKYVGRLIRTKYTYALKILKDVNLNAEFLGSITPNNPQDKFGYFTFNKRYHAGYKETIWNDVSDLSIGDKKSFGTVKKGSLIGFWVQNDCKTYYNASWLNPDRRLHVKTQVDPGNASIVFKFEDSYLGFANYCKPGWSPSGDYNDVMVRIGAPLPLAGTTLLMSSGMVLGYLRFKRKASKA